MGKGSRKHWLSGVIAWRLKRFQKLWRISVFNRATRHRMNQFRSMLKYQKIQPTPSIGFLIRWALLAVLPVVAACGDPVASWSPEDKENIRHFLTSQKADLEAIQLSNAGTPYSIMSEAERNELVRLKRVALSEATLLRDEVLAKANKDLPKQFRALYQQSLELRLRNLELGDNTAEIKGLALHNEWVGWFNANKGAIRIPK